MQSMIVKKGWQQLEARSYLVEFTALQNSFIFKRIYGCKIMDRMEDLFYFMVLIGMPVTFWIIFLTLAYLKLGFYYGNRFNYLNDRQNRLSTQTVRYKQG